MHRVAVATRAIRALGVADVVSVLLGCGAAVFISWQFGDSIGMPFLGLGAWATPPFVVAVWLVSLRVYRSQDPLVILTGVELYRRAIVGTFVAFGIVAVFGFLIDLRASRPYVVYGLPIGLFFVLALRWMVRQWLIRSRAKGGLGVPALIVDEGESIESLGQIGEFIDLVGVTSSGDPHEIAALAREKGAQAVVVRTTRYVEGRWLQQLTWALDAIGVSLLVDAASSFSVAPRMTVIPMRSRTLLAIQPLQLRTGTNPTKRTLDVLGSLVALVIFSPVMLVAALAVLIGDGNPVLFSQERIGHSGVPIRIWKFRTMVLDAEQVKAQLDAANQANGGLFKIADDPRITKVGKVLRRWSIDELPQLVNVLRGEMSLVGPRPRLQSELDGDAYSAPRIRVRPGLTGLWQVSGRSDLSDEETQTLDLMYIDTWSFTGDLVILVRTVKTILSGRGAY